ncbi:MAG: hypothetical protein HOO96_26430 [Polyangiaceae bacterium]|nr:hypothetical protein [Polyangiaceae bacterium]
MASKKTNAGQKPVGNIASINASLMLVLLDGALVPAWEPLDPDPEGDDIGGHPQKVVDFLDDDDDFVSGPLKVGKGKALVLSLEAQTGEAEVYRLANGTVALVEPPRSWWDDADNYGKKRVDVAALFDEALAGPGKGAKKAGKVDVPSGKLVTFDSNVDVAPASKVLKKALKEGDVKAFGEDEGGVVIALAPGTYAVRRQVFERKWAEDQPLVVAYLEPT